MSSSAADGSPVEPRRVFPAYGPIEALLGMLLFLKIMERATPTIVDALGTALPELAPGTVRLGLAVFLWFVVALTILDQLRRQLAALGIGSHPQVPRSRRAAPSETRALAYVAVLVVGGLVASWTFDPAMRAIGSAIRLIVLQDVAAFALVRFVLMVVFFVAYGAATHAIDRLVIGGIRAIVAD